MIKINNFCQGGHNGLPDTMLQWDVLLTMFAGYRIVKATSNNQGSQ